MLEAPPVETMQKERPLDVVRKVVAPRFPQVLEGLPEDANERVIVGRLIEAEEGLRSDGTKAGPSPDFYEVLVATSQILSKEHGNYLLPRVIDTACDASSPYQE